jgi:hypothetical protein
MRPINGRQIGNAGDAIIEFLKTLQVLPPGTHSLVVDESGRPKPWPPRP